MTQKWVLIHTTSNANSAQIVKGVLENNAILVVIINKKDSMHLHLTNAVIELYVNPSDVVNAKYIIEKNKLN
ncbi:MAG: DUF2007 domain-containing protein [Vicingaceae bacterium]|nr:DUF2007 domain-containing protein [Vicingaceae bacterium]